MRNKIKTILRRIYCTTMTMFIGVLIGQYGQPIPLVPKDNALPEIQLLQEQGASAEQLDELLEE